MEKGELVDLHFGWSCKFRVKSFYNSSTIWTFFDFFFYNVPCFQPVLMIDILLERQHEFKNPSCISVLSIFKAE